MKKIKMFGLFFLLVLPLCVFGVANGAVLTFDDVPGANKYTDNNPIPNGYGGLNWDQFYVIHKDYHPDSGYNRGVVSGEWVAFNAYDNIAIVSDSPFTFNSAYFTSAWDELNTLTVIGWSGYNPHYLWSFPINNQNPLLQTFNWSNIDKLTFDTSGEQFAMDNFTYNQTAIPEPSTMLLLGSGLIGLLGLRRKFKK